MVFFSILGSVFNFPNTFLAPRAPRRLELASVEAFLGTCGLAGHFILVGI